MPTTPMLAFTLVVGSAVALTACKRHEQPAAAANAAAASAVAPAPATVPAAPVVAAAPGSATPPVAGAPAPAAAQATSGSDSFDISRIAVTKAALPPFPYVDWPEALPATYRSIQTQEFDRAYFIVGREVRPVEGRVEKHSFINENAKLSKLAVERNYESLLKALGAIQVNAIEPDTPEIDRQNIEGLHDKLYAPNSGSYRAYLIRTPEKNIWLSVGVSDYQTQIMAVDEQPMKQSVRLTSAAPGSPVLPH